MNVSVKSGLVLDTTPSSAIAVTPSPCDNPRTPKNDHLMKPLRLEYDNKGIIDATSAFGRLPYLQDWMFQEKSSVDAVVRRQHRLSYECGHTLVRFRCRTKCCSRGSRGITTVTGSMAALLLRAATAVALRWGAATIADAMNRTTTVVGCFGACKRLCCAFGLLRALLGRQAVGGATAYWGLVPGETIPGLQLFAWQLAGRHVKA